ncbi:UNVERIFIED_ORG: drug/metabolite transporter (DMT)-like permease [Pseudomonas reinekei]
MNAWVWTAMMMIGGSLQTLMFLPVGDAMDLFQAPTLGFGQEAISHLYLPASVLAAVASIGGAWAWTIASQRLPMTLASQLLSLEMVFAFGLGLLFCYRWPTAFEAMGIALSNRCTTEIVSHAPTVPAKRASGMGLSGTYI